MAATESVIENNIIRNRDQLGYADALCIRRVRMGRGFGEVDLMLLPRRGPHRLVLVEAKLGKSPDARAKVIGQLLWYYAGALALGTQGLNLLRQFASSTPLVARSATRKGLKTLTGGISPPDLAWQELKKGRKRLPHGFDEIECGISKRVCTKDVIRIVEFNTTQYVARREDGQLSLFHWMAGILSHPVRQ